MTVRNALVLRAANSGFTENGELREFMPLHGGWSDSLFMDMPILAKAGALTGDAALLRHGRAALRLHAADRLAARRPLSPPGVDGRRLGARQRVSRRSAWR